MKKKKPNMVMTVVRLPEEYITLARKIAKDELRSYSSVIRRAVIEWLDSNNKKHK